MEVTNKVADAMGNGFVDISNTPPNYGGQITATAQSLMNQQAMQNALGPILPTATQMNAMSQMSPSGMTLSHSAYGGGTVSRFPYAVPVTTLSMTLREIGNGYVLAVNSREVFTKELSEVGNIIITEWAKLILER